MSENTTTTPSLYIVDAHAHIYASYYAIRALSGPSGEPTNAVYGFAATLLALLRDRAPGTLAVVFDPPGGSTERRAIFADYKATRQAMPEDLPGQIKRIREVLDAMGVQTAMLPGQEADDVIASLARAGARRGMAVFICSRDKDLEQLIDSRVRMYDSRNTREIDADALFAEKGYSPAQVRDVLTLTGDTSDNIPGVPGVGPKTAARLMAEFGSLDNLLANLDRVQPKLAEKIKANLAGIALARQLVALRDDLDVPIDWTRPAIQPDKPRLIALFNELGFRKLAEQMNLGEQTTQAVAAQGAATTAADCDYRCIDTPDKLDAFVAELSHVPAFAFDTETTSLDSLHCELVGISMAWQDRVGYYVPVQSPRGGGVGLPLALVRERLSPVFADARIAKMGHHTKFDTEALVASGFQVNHLAFDTMIASYLLDPERLDHKLDHLVELHLNHRGIPITDLIGKGKDQISMRDVPLDRIATYAAEDADVTWRLAGKLRPQLVEFGLDRLLVDVEMPLVEVLADMERRGVALDVPFLEKMSEQMDVQIKDLAGRIYDCAGGSFNIDSTKQLADVLFNRLKLASGKKTKTGFSTDSEVLEQLSCLHEVPRLVLEYRQIQKLKGTYVDALPRMIHPGTRRVHPTFTQTRTATGRLACQEPNLQNIPIRTELGRQIRRAFVPGSADNVLLTADYSQIELRMLAHFSRDPALVQAFAQDQDIHTFVASQVFGVMPELVDSEQRRRAKAVNFGIIYGQTAFGLSRALGIGQKEAQDFIDAYFKRYGTIRRFLDQCVQDAQRTGHATTILGRRRAIADINSSNRSQRAMAERTAVNTVTQGSAADLIKLAMINIHRRIRVERLPVQMLIQVHDELVFELPAAGVQEHAEMIRHEMTTALNLDVPLKVDIAWGKSWLEAK